MELNPKQRAALRGMANTLTPVLYIGKEGISDATVKETYDVLQARELIKCAVLQNAPLSAREAAQELCLRTGASPVQVIGNQRLLNIAVGVVGQCRGAHHRQPAPQQLLAPRVRAQVAQMLHGHCQRKHQHHNQQGGAIGRRIVIALVHGKGVDQQPMQY